MSRCWKTTLRDRGWCRGAALREAIEQFRNINDLARMPYYLSVLADALAHGGHMKDAEDTIRTALDIAHARHEMWCLAEVLRVQAATATTQGRMEEAGGILGRAMAHAAGIGAPSWRLRAGIDLVWPRQAGGNAPQRSMLEAPRR